MQDDGQNSEYFSSWKAVKFDPEVQIDEACKHVNLPAVWSPTELPIMGCATVLQLLMLNKSTSNGVSHVACT